MLFQQPGHIVVSHVLFTAGLPMLGVEARQKRGRCWALEVSYWWRRGSRARRADLWNAEVGGSSWVGRDLDGVAFASQP